MEIPLRLINVITCAIVAFVNFEIPTKPCPRWGYHRVEKEIYRDSSLRDTKNLDLDAVTKPRIEDMLGLRCLHCNLEFTPEIYNSSTNTYSNRDDKKPEVDRLGSVVYNTPTGKPQAGDVYYAPWYPHLDGKPVIVVKLPNDHLWPSNQIATNCPHGENKLRGWHQCWTVEGEVPNITVTPSIEMGEGESYIHGWIREGKWIDC